MQFGFIIKRNERLIKIGWMAGHVLYMLLQARITFEIQRSAEVMSVQLVIKLIIIIIITTSILIVKVHVYLIYVTFTYWVFTTQFVLCFVHPLFYSKKA